jgi:hypothetical protein
MGGCHCIENLSNELYGHRLVEEIAHTVDEDHSWLFPAKGQLNLIGMKRDTESIAISWITHCMEAGSKPLGVAMLAARTDFRATGNGVPRSISPLDSRFFSHFISPRI